MHAGAQPPANPTRIPINAIVDRYNIVPALTNRFGVAICQLRPISSATLIRLVQPYADPTFRPT
jgi:hypothetical protein